MGDFICCSRLHFRAGFVFTSYRQYAGSFSSQSIFGHSFLFSHVDTDLIIDTVWVHQLLVSRGQETLHLIQRPYVNLFK